MKKCPRCASDNTSPAERRFISDYPFWMVLVFVLGLLVFLFAVFLLLQLHPVILILVVVAVISRLIRGRGESKKTEKKEYLCLDCQKRFR